MQELTEEMLAVSQRQEKLGVPSASGRARRWAVELCGGKEKKAGEINWKMDFFFLFPTFNPDNIYFITQWDFYIQGMHNKIFYIKLILITALVFGILWESLSWGPSSQFFFSPEWSENKQVFKVSIYWINKAANEPAMEEVSQWTDLWGRIIAMLSNPIYSGEI